MSFTPISAFERPAFFRTRTSTSMNAPNIAESCSPRRKAGFTSPELPGARPRMQILERPNDDQRGGVRCRLLRLAEDHVLPAPLVDCQLRIDRVHSQIDGL